MNQRVEIKIEGATIVVSSETIRARIIRQNLLGKTSVCIQALTTSMGVDENDNNTVIGMFNYCVLSSRVEVTKGKLPFELLLPSDSDEIAIEKSLLFFQSPFGGIYEELVNLIARIDKPDDFDLSPDATKEYEDMTDDEIDELPEDEKKS